MIDANTPIKIYNHGTSAIGLKGQAREYLLPGARLAPTVLTMFFSDVEFINSRCSVFRNGTLRFDPAEQEAIYVALNLHDWQKTTLFDEDIIRIIIAADMDGMRRLLEVEDVYTMQRVRGHMIALATSSSHDISNRVIDLIEKRTTEINNGIRKTKISIDKQIRQIEAERDPRIGELEKQIADMQAQMEAMQRAQSAPRRAQKKLENQED